MKTRKQTSKQANEPTSKVTNKQTNKQTKQNKTKQTHTQKTKTCNSNSPSCKMNRVDVKYGKSRKSNKLVYLLVAMVSIYNFTSHIISLPGRKYKLPVLKTEGTIRIDQSH